MLILHGDDIWRDQTADSDDYVRMRAILVAYRCSEIVRKYLGTPFRQFLWFIQFWLKMPLIGGNLTINAFFWTNPHSHCWLSDSITTLPPIVLSLIVGLTLHYLPILFSSYPFLKAEDPKKHIRVCSIMIPVFFTSNHGWFMIPGRECGGAAEAGPEPCQGLALKTRLGRVAHTTGALGTQDISQVHMGGFHKWGYPQIIHSCLGFPFINQPFWGSPFMETPHTDDHISQHICCTNIDVTNG